MSHLWRLPLLTAGVALALAGCGGSSSDDSGTKAPASTPTQASTPTPVALTKAQLISEGDKICRKMATAVKAIDSGNTPQEVAVSVGKTITAYEQMLADLAALTPPADLASDYQAWLDANDGYKALLAQFKTAANAGDRAAAEKLQPKMNAKTEQLTKMAKDIGFKVCTQSK